MYLVGLTGGIATGKSTVSHILRDDLGCAVVDADLHAREILLPGKKAYHAVVKEFGQNILTADGTIDRAALGDIVFNDQHSRKKLNAITHKEIGKAILWEICKHFLKGERFVILDIPLLIESKFWLPYLRHIVVVSCDHSVQLERLMQRNNYSEQEAISRINSQMPLKDKIKFATSIIDNNGSMEGTKESVLQLHTNLQKSRSFNLYEICFGFVLTVSLIAFFCY